MAPPVAPSPQMGSSATPIDVQRGCHFSDAQAGERNADHHFSCKFHPCCRETELANSGGFESSKTAVKVSDRNFEKQPTDEAEDRIAQIPMQRWHRTWSNPASEPISHYQIGTGAKFFDERRQILEIIAAIGVSHDHVFAASSLNTPQQGSPIAALSNGNDASAQTHRYGL